MNKKKRAPSNLSKESQRWFRKIVDEYGIVDAGGLLISQATFEAFDDMRGAQAILKVEGLTIIDRFGQQKPHPLNNVVRDCRAQVFQGLKALNLDLEPLKDSIGRPPGGNYAS